MKKIYIYFPPPQKKYILEYFPPSCAHLWKEGDTLGIQTRRQTCHCWGFPLSPPKHTRGFSGWWVRLERCVCKYGQCPWTACASTRGPVMLGKKRSPNPSHFTNKQGDEEFSQWIEPRTMPGMQTPLRLKSRPLRGTEKWLEPQRTGEAQLLAEDEARPLVPLGTRPSPDFTLLEGVHGRARRAAEVLCELLGVGDGADDTETRGAVGIGDEPLV